MNGTTTTRSGWCCSADLGCGGDATHRVQTPYVAYSVCRRHALQVRINGIGRDADVFVSALPRAYTGELLLGGAPADL